MKKLRKLIRVMLEDVNEDNQKKEVVPEQFKYQSFDEIVIEFHRDNVVSTLVTKLLDFLLFIIMFIATVVLFSFLIIYFDLIFTAPILLKIRTIENLYLYYFIAFVTWFFMLYGIIHVRKKHVCKKINVDTHEDVMKDRGKWIYNKFQTQELSNYIEQFSTHQTELFVLKDFFGFIKMCLNNKALEIVIFGAVTFFVNAVSKDSNYLIKVFSFNIKFISQVMYMFILCYVLYALIKLVQLILALVIDDFTNPNKVNNLRKQRFLDALQDANKYKVYQ